MSNGRFLWNELVTTDVDGGATFYGELFGWRRNDITMGNGMGYTLLDNGQFQEAGINAHMQAPAHWLPYLSTEDVDATLAKIEAHGGKVLHRGNGDQMEIAVFADDQGAVAALVKGEERPVLDRRPEPGEFCWYSLSTTDLDKAKAFYTAVFGWDAQDMDMGGGTTASTFFWNGQPVADIQTGQPGPNHWGSCICVDAIDSALEKAVGLGAETLAGPFPIGEMGTLAVVKDPTGAVVSLWGANA